MHIQQFITTGAVLLAAAAAQAQEKAPIDYPARLQSVETLKGHIAQREKRFEALKADVRALDQRVEGQIDTIVKTLASIKDSQDSKNKVSSMKEDVMQALGKTIGLYRQKHRAIFERMRTDKSVPQEELAKDLKVFDERIGKRIDQLTELSKSFPGHQDVDKFEYTTEEYSNGYFEESARISEEWKQNRRQSSQTDSQRRELLEKLEKAIADTTARRKSIAEILASRKLNDREKAAQEGEIGRLDAAITELKKHRRELALPSAGAAQSIGREEAHDVGEMIDDARTDLSRDMADIFRKYSELDQERTKIFSLKDNLKAREEWLNNNPPPVR